MRNRLVKDDSHPRQLRTVDRERLRKRMGELTAATLDTVFGRLGEMFEPLLQAFQRTLKPPGPCGSSMRSHFMGPPRAEWEGESSRLP